MAVTTKVQGQLMDWTKCDETAAIETGALDSGEGQDDDLEGQLNIVMAHMDANANTGTAVGWVLFGKVGTTDEDWRRITQGSATLTTATKQDIAAASGSGQANPDRVEIAATAGFTIGLTAFLYDTGTIGNSCLINIVGVAANDYVQNMDAIVNAYDTDDDFLNVVDEWCINIPNGYSSVKVVFFNNDADSELACRVDYALVATIG
jgi:hypothetical protein